MKMLLLLVLICGCAFHCECWQGYSCTGPQYSCTPGNNECCSSLWCDDDTFSPDECEDKIKTGYECNPRAKENPCKDSRCENLSSAIGTNYAFCGKCVADDGVAVYNAASIEAQAKRWNCCAGYHFVEGVFYAFTSRGYCSQSTLPSPYLIEVTGVSVVVLFLFVCMAYKIGYRCGEKKSVKSVLFDIEAADTEDDFDEENKPFHDE